MAQFALNKIALSEVRSLGLRTVIVHEGDTATVEAYRVHVDGYAEWAEVLYLGARDMAGVAWGSDPTWFVAVASLEDACHQAFDAA